MNKHAIALTLLATTLGVKSIVCASCAKTITHALKADPGVKTVQVDIKKKLVSVTYDSDKTSPARLAKSVDEAGYPAQVQF